MIKQSRPPRDVGLGREGDRKIGPESGPTTTTAQQLQRDLAELDASVFSGVVVVPP